MMWYLSRATFVVENTIDAKRIKTEVTPTPPKQNLTQLLQLNTRSPIAILNELRNNLKYVVESQAGPPHAPVFTVTTYRHFSTPYKTTRVF